MQAIINAAPALKPAVEVWREARQAYNAVPNPYPGAGAEAAAAVIEADRAAIIAAKDAKIADLKGKLAEDNADLPTIAYFAGAADARDRLAALQAHADALAGALETVKQCQASCFWGADAEKYARAAWRGAFRKVTQALRAYEEFRRD